jgi:hypothetical protein
MTAIAAISSAMTATTTAIAAGSAVTTAVNAQFANAEHEGRRRQHRRLLYIGRTIAVHCRRFDRHRNGNRCGGH